MPFLATQKPNIPTKDLLSWIFDDLSYDWDEPMYIDAQEPTRTISARQAKKTIRQLAAGFRAIGLRKGDCVSIHSFNAIEYPMFFLGVIAAGGTFAGTNPGYTPHELAHALKTVKAKYVLVQPGLVEPMKHACRELGLSDEKIIIFNPVGEAAPKGHLQWRDLFQHGEEDWVRFNDLDTSSNTTAALCFSSGTTGLPKAVMLSHHNFISYHTMLHEVEPRPFKVRRLCSLPFFHAATIPAIHVSTLRLGEKAFVLPRFEPRKWFWANEKYEISEIGVVPPVVVLAINSPDREKFSLKAAKYAVCGAAPLDKGPQARMEALLGGAPMTQVWGMTESTCVATRFQHWERDATGSVGRPLPGLDMKLVDDDGKDISRYDVRGELCLRGPSITRGYFENPEANQRDWDEEGFFHTGDVGFCDGKTKLWYIVDRKKELIKVRAFQVAPAELEGVLLSHPQIVDAAVIGVPDPSSHGSELPRAYLVRRPGSDGSPSATEVHDLVRSKLAAYKALQGGVLFVDSIPKSASGKILKRILRDETKKETSAKL